jgi:NAD(P)-dependent dehydrogenase (short-subunit alcohol dehydrogenase family)
MNRTVVVTGAGAGIGAAITASFAAAGDRVFACDISSEHLENMMSKTEGHVEPVVLDVSDESLVQEIMIRAQTDTGSLDVLVNNAGVADGKASVLEMSTRLWERVLTINLTGAFLCAREAARLMVPQGRGRIINIASISVLSGRTNGVAYTASKAGMFGMTRRLAYELGPHGITTNCILVGAIDTDIWHSSQSILGDDFPPGEHIPMSEELRRELVPARRRGNPEEIAAAVLYLASDTAAFVNGASLPVDGGRLAV